MIDFETHVKRTISFWCNKLTQSARTIVFDKVKEEPVSVPSPFCPAQDGLESMVWAKVIRPKVQEKLQSIWSDSSPKGGMKGVSRFLSVICTNTLIDENRKLTLRKAEVTGTSLQTRLEDEDGNRVVLIDLITDDESGLMLPFGIEDLKHVLDHQEYKVLIDHFVHDGDLTSIADDLDISTRTATRVAKRAIAKVAGWLRQLKHGPLEMGKAYQKPLLVGMPWRQPRTTRPDYILAENLEHWNDDAAQTKVVPFHICPHNPPPGTLEGSESMWQMEHGGARWGLCESCQVNYWLSLVGQMGWDLAVWQAAQYAGTWGLGFGGKES